MSATPAQLKATNKWRKKALVQYSFSVNTETEADIIEKMNSVDNKAGYMKKLIRKDIQE